MIEQDKTTIIAIITKYLPDARIYLFGSRARHDNTPESDIDILVDNGMPIDNHALSCISDDLEESTIPFTVDVVDAHRMSQEFSQDIMKDRVLWK